MHIFMTGSTGYIGAPLARRLIEAGHQVTGFARSAEAAEKMAAAGQASHRGEVDNPGEMSEILASVDAVIHVAVGLPRGVTKTDFTFAEVLTRGLSGTGKPLILTSGLGVYAGVSEAYVDETTSLAPPVEIQALRVKLEQLVLAASSQDVRSIVLRPAHVYGRGAAGTLVRTLLGTAMRDGAGAFIGDGIVPVSTVHVDDLVEAYLAALDHGKAGQIYNLVSGEVYMKDLARAVTRAIGKTSEGTSLTPEEASAKWGPLAALYGTAPVVSGSKAVMDLGWKATAPSVVYELVHGSLRVAS